MKLIKQVLWFIAMLVFNLLWWLIVEVIPDIMFWASCVKSRIVDLWHQAGKDRTSEDA